MWGRRPESTPGKPMSDELQLWYSHNHRSEGAECREDGAEPHKQN